MKNDASLWRDLRQIKFRYIALVGICLVGGGIYRGHSDDPVSDDVVDLIDYDNEAIYLGSEHDYADYSNEDRVAEYIEQYMEGADYNDIKNLGDVRTLIQSLKLVGGNWRERQSRNTDYIFSLVEGAEKSEILRSLGKPDFSQQFDSGVEILMYRTRQEKNDLLTTKDETAALVFQADELVGFVDSSDWFGGDRATVDMKGYQSVETSNKEQIDLLENGVDRGTIIDNLGQPDFIDHPGTGLEVLSYRTQTILRMGYTSRNEVTPLLVKDGALVAKGRREEFLNKVPEKELIGESITLGNPLAEEAAEVTGDIPRDGSQIRLLGRPQGRLQQARKYCCCLELLGTQAWSACPQEFLRSIVTKDNGTQILKQRMGHPAMGCAAMSIA